MTAAETGLQEKAHVCDVLILGAKVVDGSGQDAYLAHVAITADKIVAIQKVSQVNERPHYLGHRKVDGKGLVLAPGFIDVHTHDDTNVIRNPEMLPKVSQGITTVIVGNCGISAAPVRLTGAPPDPMNLLGEQADFVYPEFADYAAAVEAHSPAVNVAALVGHTALRNNVMNDLLRPAYKDEIIQMRQQLHQAMEQGALGLSSGLAYYNANAAPAEEVQALVDCLRQHDGIYTTHLRTEFDEIIPAMNEAFDTAKQGQVPLVISHLKCAGAGNWGRTTETLALFEHRAQHQHAACDCYPYSASSSTLDLNQVTDEFEIFITWSESEPSMAGQTLASIASQWQLPLLDAAKRLQPAGAVYHGLHPEDVKRVLAYPRTMVGSDGLPNDPHPHPRLWGAFPRVLGYYCRELALFSLPQAVHKMTGLSAQQFGLKKRGLVKEGYFADLVLFDPDRIIDKASFSEPKQVASGIVALYVNGQLTYQEAASKDISPQVTARAGRMLRRK
ncbi:N-acyl-D-amino-acid deacylase family protein [Motilimonas pumila]|uniref:D-aminoacylase n=1 Tax=Motilimonas pumila TaxID=2303987 RepID=A0A418YFC2_9GAMM|nr:D-aminoacylase [Motilimonas pumila]RJG47894.1 D-aminoacylase [Motilimonas pumila]